MSAHARIGIVRPPIPLTQPVDWHGFIKHVLDSNPSRIATKEEIQIWVDRYWADNPLLEGRQWRRAGTHTAQPAAGSKKS